MTPHEYIGKKNNKKVIFKKGKHCWRCGKNLKKEVPSGGIDWFSRGICKECQEEIINRWSPSVPSKKL